MAKGGKRGRAVKGGQAAEVVKGSSGGGQGGQAQVGGQASGYIKAQLAVAWHGHLDPVYFEKNNLNF